MAVVHEVTSNQTDIYKNLEQVVRKYAATRFLRPIADHTREAFRKAEEFIDRYYEKRAEMLGQSLHDKSNSPKAVIPAYEPESPRIVILDSGCGTGESTLHLAKRFPGIPVIGIDKSAVRLTKAGNERQLEQLDNSDSLAVDEIPENAFWVRAELLDFWRLAQEAVTAGRWSIKHHAVFYPNPWPKESEATRRFHLHPIFPTMISLSPVTELRTNWEIYAKEFAEAARIVCGITNYVDDKTAAKIVCETFDPVHPETAFERKYKEAHQQLWRTLVIR